jgi:hypothetical protein
MTSAACTGPDIGSLSPETTETTATPGPSPVQIEPGGDQALAEDEADIANAGAGDLAVLESPFVSYSYARYMASIHGAPALDEYLRGELPERASYDAFLAGGILEFDEDKKCSYLVQVEDDTDRGIFANDDLPDRIPLAWEEGATAWDQSRQELSYWLYPDWLFNTEPTAVFSVANPVGLMLHAVSDERRDSSVPTEFLVPPTANCGGQIFYVFDAKDLS